MEINYYNMSLNQLKGCTMEETSFNDIVLEYYNKILECSIDDVVTFQYEGKSFSIVTIVEKSKATSVIFNENFKNKDVEADPLLTINCFKAKDNDPLLKDIEVPCVVTRFINSKYITDTGMVEFFENFAISLAYSFLYSKF